MQTCHLKLFKLATLVMLALPTLVAAQSSANSPDWETLRPEKEQFSVQIPKGSTYEEASKVPYHRMELNTRFYVRKTEGGPIFAVVSLSGIKSNPAQYTEMQRVNSYVDAFKTLFLPKIRDKAGLTQLTYVRDRTLQGNPGREYRLTVGKLSGLAHVYATSRRFYAVVYLDTKKDETIQEQFLSSFVIPEKIQTATVATDQTPVRAEAPVPAEEISAAKQEAAKEAGDSQKAAEGGAAAGGEGVVDPAKRAPISGGVLNGKALSLPSPEYPPVAKQAKASGAVAVKVLVDESGSVVTAQAVSGHQLLQAAAVAAARQARFSPTLLMGEPVKVSGVIVYNFGEPMN